MTPALTTFRYILVRINDEHKLYRCAFQVSVGDQVYVGGMLAQVIDHSLWAEGWADEASPVDIPWAISLKWRSSNPWAKEWDVRKIEAPDDIVKGTLNRQHLTRYKK